MPAPIPLEPPVTRATLPLSALVCIAAVNTPKFSIISHFGLTGPELRFKPHGNKLRRRAFIASWTSHEVIRIGWIVRHPTKSSYREFCFRLYVDPLSRHNIQHW
jgi:hypothetical protein